MNIDDNDFDRLVAGEPSADDPAWSGVADFLDDLRSAYPPAPITALEAEHLAAVAREARTVAAQATGTNVLSMRRAQFRRVLVSSVAGAAVLLTAGVGAAAALGFNPIAQWVAPRVDPPAVAPIPAQPSGSDRPASDEGQPGTRPTSVPPGSVSTPTGRPATDPTESAKSGKPEGTGKPEKEKADKKDKPDKKVKADKPDNDKSDKPDKDKPEKPVKEKKDSGSSEQSKDEPDKTNNGTQKSVP